MVITTQIAREETRCHHTSYSFRLAGRVLLYASSNRQNNTNQGLCYIICATPAGHNIHKHNRHFVELYYFKFKFQPEHHNWCNKSRGMYYPACGIVHIKNPLLLVGKSRPCSGGCGFPLNNPSTIHFHSIYSNRNNAFKKTQKQNRLKKLYIFFLSYLIL